jgi:hypothetical protein
MYQELTHICTRCRQEDTTSFSSCRFCGTKYDLEALKNKIDFSHLLVYSGLGVIVFCVGLFYFEKNQTLALPILFFTMKHANPKKAEASPKPLSLYMSGFLGPGQVSSPTKTVVKKVSSKIHKNKR